MFFLFCYEIYLILLSIWYLPVFFYEFLFKKKYRRSALNLFGYKFPKIQKGIRPLIWLHADSLGEVRAIVPLIKPLKEKYHPIFIFSTRTETGYEEACKAHIDYPVYLPLDFGWVVKPIVKRTLPDLVIISEEDFWFNFLSTAKKVGAVIVVANGKLSMSSMMNYLKVPYFMHQLFSCIDLFCIQSKLYLERFASLKIPIDKLIITGNLKLDGEFEKLSKWQIDEMRLEIEISPDDPVLIIGSSHHPEEEELIKIIIPLWKFYPNLKVILVPRHPERFDEVANILQKNNVNYLRFSQRNKNKKNASFILIDAMGLLPKYYQLADIAIVAGSYTAKIGGHNILEPAWYGIPVIFGPYMYAQPELVELIKKYGAGLQVPLEKLQNLLLELFTNQKRRNQFKEASLRLVSDVHGATEKTIVEIEKKLENNKFTNYSSPDLMKNKEIK